MKKQIVAAVLSTIIPVSALAGPVVGLGYTDIGLTGHSGRPGIQIFAGNLYHNDVIASGQATFARGYYGFNAELGKLIPAGGVSFEPYLSMGFLSLNYNQQKVGYKTVTRIAGYGFAYTQTTPSSSPQPASLQDFYGLAGADLNIPVASKVTLGIGGGFGHTLTTFGGSGNGGAVYTGDAMAAFQIAPHIVAGLNVSYLHVPGASLTNYGASLAYHFF